MDFETIDKEISEFLVDGKITKLSKLKWLESKKVITLKNDIFRIRPDKGTEKTSCKNYEKYEEALEKYLDEKWKRQKYSKKSEIINNFVEDLPF